MMQVRAIFVPLTVSTLLAAGAAVAADLPSRRAPVPMAAPPVFTWTGFSFGTMTGYGFTDGQSVRTRGNNDGTGGLTNTQLNVAQARRPPVLRGNQDGITGFGLGAGYDYQFTPGSGLVLGAAVDFTLMNLERRTGYLSPPQASNAFTPEISGFRQSLDWLSTVRARVGYAFDRVLVYGTGGFAFGEVNYRAAFLRNTDQSLVYAGQYSDIATGYVYGGGVEYALPDDSFFTRYNLLSLLNIKPAAITAKVEYLRYDLGHHNVTVANTLPGGPTGSYTSRFASEGNLVRGGLTYRFNGL